MNFPEYDCDNEEILEFLSHLPITTVDDYPWMQKYIDDLQLHYQRAEYELAVISVHMIYMFIVYCYILKKRGFDLSQIQADFQCDQEHCPKVTQDISPYLYVHKGDKKCFTHLKLDKKIEKQHMNIVNTRDRVAHCSGNILKEIDFVKYMQKCIENIFHIKNVIWNNFKQSMKFNNELENMIDWNDVISIFLISRKEFEDLFEEKFITKMQKKLSDITLWQEMIDNTVPANYGVNDYDIYVDDVILRYEDLNSECINGSFESNISMIYTFQMASSNPEEGYEEHYNKQHHITGSFEFDINSEEFNIQIDTLPSIDFYAE